MGRVPGTRKSSEGRAPVWASVPFGPSVRLRLLLHGCVVIALLGSVGCAPNASTPGPRTLRTVVPRSIARSERPLNLSTPKMVHVFGVLRARAESAAPDHQIPPTILRQFGIRRHLGRYAGTWLGAPILLQPGSRGICLLDLRRVVTDCWANAIALRGDAGNQRAMYGDARARIYRDSGPRTQRCGKGSNSARAISACNGRGSR